MVYTYNPHRHVKIWLSPDSNVFMNIENQLRLIRMRSINPNDAIHLVYDRSLLTLNAINELESFCAKYEIKPIDVQTQIIPSCQTTEELNLITLYQDEITHLNNGGNLGAASDILRYLGPVYRLGTYTDFDEEVDTRNAPPTISVNAPILFNIGSFPSDELEVLVLNTDTLTVVDPLAADEIIKKIQRSIYESCLRQENGESPYKKILQQLITNLEKQEKWLQLLFIHTDSIVIELTSLHRLNESRSAREFRQYVLEFTANNDVFLKKEGYENKPHEYIEMMRATHKTLPSNDDELVTIVRKNSRCQLLKNIIVNTTGPTTTLLSVFPEKSITTTDDIKTSVSPYAFETYHLDKIFQSKNSLRLHASREEGLTFLGANSREINDISWLQEGINAQKERETKMNKSALIIQSFFRSYQVRKEIANNAEANDMPRPSFSPGLRK